MEKYLFLFYDEAALVDWECSVFEEKISEGLAVQIAFNMLILRESADRVLIYSSGAMKERFLISSVHK